MLTDAVIARAPTKATTYKLYDELGLSLVIPPIGRPRWRFDFRLHGKRRTMSLGVYDDVTLAAARRRRTDMRRLVAEGQDPVRARKQDRLTERAAAHFGGLAEDWFTTKTKRLAQKTVTKKRLILDRHILPLLKRIPVRDVKASDVLAMLRKVEAQGLYETTRRARQIVGEILRFGVATGQAERDVTPDLVDALEPMHVTHRPALTEPSEVGGLLRAIGSMHETPQLRAALRMLAMTFVRPGELRLARWAEFDEAAAVWRVPADRTKQRADHLVPLSRQVLKELKSLRDMARGSEYVLPTPRTIRRPLSNAAFGAALARLGYDSGTMTPHGFRAMARTLLDEQLHEPPDTIEAQLGHATRGPLGDTYNRSRHLAHRKAMMQRYSDYLDGLAAGR